MRFSLTNRENWNFCVIGMSVVKTAYAGHTLKQLNKKGTEETGGTAREHRVK